MTYDNNRLWERFKQILVVLSTHASAQGQVFACTPSSISKANKFEEFCSVHDFVTLCQDVFGEKLSGVHVSFFIKGEKLQHEEITMTALVVCLLCYDVGSIAC